jgi:hypothetical protein
MKRSGQKMARSLGLAEGKVVWTLWRFGLSKGTI